jgi:hypothetical protein
MSDYDQSFHWDFALPCPLWYSILFWSWSHPVFEAGDPSSSKLVSESKEKLLSTALVDSASETLRRYSDRYIGRFGLGLPSQMDGD